MAYLLTALLGIVWLCQVYFFVFVFGRILRQRVSPRQTDAPRPPVSVVVCAHNEATNLPQLLESLIVQQYPEYEIIIINDRSTDNSLNILKEYAKKYYNIHYYTIDTTPIDFNSKKYALQYGISKTKYQYILLTDADCVAASAYWIDYTMQSINNNTKIVLGISLYKKYNTIISNIIQYETFYTAIQYIGFALSKMPYMGVGRNLLYEKYLLATEDIFPVSQQNITGGDDDLLVNRLATAHNTRVCLHPEAYTYSVPPNTWAAWYHQKIRHLSVGKHYRTTHKLMLGTLYGTQFAFWAIGVMSFCIDLDNFATAFYTIFALRCVIVWGILIRLNQKLRAQVPVQYIPVFELLFGLYIFTFGMLAAATRRIKWKT